MAANQARQDLRDKLILEGRLFETITALNRRIVRETARQYGLDGTALKAEIFRGDIADMLRAHYLETSNIFSKRLSTELPGNIALTEAEQTIIDSALTNFFTARSGDQAQIITDTNQRDIDESIVAANATAQAEALTGVATSQQEIAVIAAAALGRKLTGRAGAIASYETQLAAEAAKGTEAEVLIGQDPSVLVGSPQRTFARKEWVTVGDEKVREAHMFADGQVVDINESFTVGGELLRWPGDTSLGASLENVINCRCSATYDEQTIFTVRQETNQ